MIDCGERDVKPQKLSGGWCDPGAQASQRGQWAARGIDRRPQRDISRSAAVVAAEFHSLGAMWKAVALTITNMMPPAANGASRGGC
jgi:hypothetical protein